MATTRYPAAPFTAPISGDINQRLSQIADAINRKADANGATVFPFIGLTDSTGQTWKITVDTSGVLHTEVVTR
jgi:hypothetical protein